MITTNNPLHVVVSAEINMHQALKAVEEFVNKYPVERMAVEQAVQLEEYAGIIRKRITDEYIRRTNIAMTWRQDGQTHTFSQTGTKATTKEEGPGPYRY